ncbi:hypothetical protein LX36DRAFT_663681 [Colletotrichum falcatum]|nr:hypothetical protein LX36DRAFT_663681 [Colletotrichum falcatum]
MPRSSSSLEASPALLSSHARSRSPSSPHAAQTTVPPRPNASVKLTPHRPALRRRQRMRGRYNPPSGQVSCLSV